MYSTERMKEIARGGVERGLDVPEDASPDEIYSDAFDLAFDALTDKGVSPTVAREIADYTARLFAQP